MSRFSVKVSPDLFNFKDKLLNIIYLAAVTNHGWALLHVPNEYITQDICLVAVTNNGLALKYVPKEYRTHDICLTADKTNDRIEMIEMIEEAIER